MSEIIGFAIDNSPFYGPWLLEHGFDRAAAADPRNWDRLPILERSVVKEHAAAFPTQDDSPKNSRDAQTGGSTGEPLRTRHDARVPSLAFSWRMYSWWGVEPSDNLARIGRWRFDRWATLRNGLEWWPTSQLYLDASVISPATVGPFAERFQRVKPRLFEGYVGAMLEFADFVEANSISLPAPVAVATTAAPLTESARARLEAVFGAPVYDEYRGSEVGWMAGECSAREGLHIFADWRRIDIVDEEGHRLPAGEIGDIVITDLGNRVFPLIRYRLGDKGILLDEPCSCGRSLPLMASPQGRTTDLIRLPSGAVLAHRLMGMFSGAPDAVRLFQIHQQSDYSITVRVVLGSAGDARAAVGRAVEALRERIQHEVPVVVEVVDALPYTGGKVKYVISDVPPRT